MAELTALSPVAAPTVECIYIPGTPERFIEVYSAQLKDDLDRLAARAPERAGAPGLERLVHAYNAVTGSRMSVAEIRERARKAPLTSYEQAGAASALEITNRCIAALHRELRDAPDEAARVHAALHLDRQLERGLTHHFGDATGVAIQLNLDPHSTERGRGYLTSYLMVEHAFSGRPSTQLVVHLPHQGAPIYAMADGSGTFRLELKDEVVLLAAAEVQSLTLASFDPGEFVRASWRPTHALARYADLHGFTQVKPQDLSPVIDTMLTAQSLSELQHTFSTRGLTVARRRFRSAAKLSGLVLYASTTRQVLYELDQVVVPKREVERYGLAPYAIGLAHRLEKRTLPEGTCALPDGIRTHVGLAAILERLKA